MTNNKKLRDLMAQHRYYSEALAQAEGLLGIAELLGIEDAAMADITPLREGLARVEAELEALRRS